MSAVLIVGLVGVVCWLVASDWRRESQQTAWDEFIATVITDTDLAVDPDADLIFQQMCWERWEAEL